VSHNQPETEEQPQLLWTLRGRTGRLITAAIHRSAGDAELRITFGPGGDVVEVMQSLAGDMALLARAAGFRLQLEAQGWTAIEPS